MRTIRTICLYLVGLGVNFIIFILAVCYFHFVNDRSDGAGFITIGYSVFSLCSIFLYLPYFLFINVRVFSSKIFRFIILFLPATVFLSIAVYGCVDAIESFLVMLPYYATNFTYGLYVEKRILFRNLHCK